MDRGAWWATVHEAERSPTQLSEHTRACTHTHTHRSLASEDSINHQLCSPVVFTVEKYLHLSESVQFKPMLFKDQL